MKKTILIIVVIIVAIFAVFKLASNHKRNTTLDNNLFTNEVTVSVAPVELKSLSPVLNLTGIVYPIKELDIAAEIQGKVKSLQFNLGSNVSSGSVIALLDDETKRLAYETAKVDADKQEKNFNRIKNMLSGGTSSEQEFDNAKSAYETAKIKVQDAAKQLSYTKITAPMSGTIAKKYVEAGAYVKDGAAIASIVDISKLKVKVSVSENNAYYIKLGSTATLTSDIYPGVELQGKVSFVSPRGDESHNYPIEIELVNSGKYPLKGGTFVMVKFQVGENKTGLFIPREALQGSVKDARVYVAENGKAFLKNIVIGRESTGSLEVISGLKENEKVIVSGQVNLADNKAIKIINNN